MCCTKKGEHPSSRGLCTCIQNIPGRRQHFLYASCCCCSLTTANRCRSCWLQTCVVGDITLWVCWVWVEGVVGQGGCRFTAFKPFKRRIFVVISYWTVSHHLSLNLVRTLLYICLCTVIKSGSRKFPKSYFLYRRKFYCCRSSSPCFVEPGTFE